MGAVFLTRFRKTGRLGGEACPTHPLLGIHSFGRFGPRESNLSDRLRRKPVKGALKILLEQAEDLLFKTKTGAVNQKISLGQGFF